MLCKLQDVLSTCSVTIRSTGKLLTTPSITHKNWKFFLSIKSVSSEMPASVDPAVKSPEGVARALSATIPVTSVQVKGENLKPFLKAYRFCFRGLFVLMVVLVWS